MDTLAVPTLPWPLTWTLATYPFAAVGCWTTMAAPPGDGATETLYGGVPPFRTSENVTLAAAQVPL